MRKIWSLGGIGTFLSVIVVYFIYKVAQENGWTLLKWLAFAYLLFWIIIGGIFILGLLLVIVIMLAGILITYVRYKWLKRKFKNKTKVIDAEFKVKE